MPIWDGVMPFLANLKIWSWISSGVACILCKNTSANPTAIYVDGIDLPSAIWEGFCCKAAKSPRYPCLGCEFGPFCWSEVSGQREVLGDD